MATLISASRYLINPLLLLLWCSISIMTARADTGDVIDDFLPVATDQFWCAGSAGAVWADIDQDGSYETQVVFTTLTGEALVTAENTAGKWYFFSMIDSNCGGTSPYYNRGRIKIHFIDMLAPGFVWNDSNTWVFKAVKAVSVRAFHDTCYAYDAPRFQDPNNQPYLSVQAYQETGQNQPVSPASAVPPGSWTNYAFSDPAGIKELFVSTDFCENTLDDLVLYANELPPDTGGGGSGNTPGVALLFDTSGSMGWRHDGSRPAPAAEQRITMARNAAIPFLEMMNDFNAGQANFGIARFPMQPALGRSCNAQNVTGMTTIDDTSSGTAIATTIPGLTTSGNTPLLAGVSQALNLFGTEAPRAIVLLSDGYHNCPSTVAVGDPVVTQLINTATAANTRIYTIGFGRPADVDHPLLSALATQTGGTFYDVTDATFDPATWNPATALDSAYVKILVDGLGLQAGVDPLGVATAGQTVSGDFHVNRHDRKVAFYLSWATPQTGRLDLTVRSSDGVAVPTSGPGIRFHEGPTFKILTVKQSFLQQADKVGAAPWQLEITNNESAAENYQYTILLESDLEMTATFGKRNIYSGDMIALEVTLHAQGKPLAGVTDLVASLSRPEESLGNWYAKNKVTPQELEQVSAKAGDESLSDLARKTLFLNDIRGIAFPGRAATTDLQLVDDGTNGDRIAGDAVYTAQIPATLEGNYAVLVRVAGETATGYGFEREAQLSRYVPPGIDPGKTGVKIVRRSQDDSKLQLLDLIITPKDAAGNFVGPRYAGTIAVAAEWGRLVGQPRDNLDGTYTQTVALPAGEAPAVKFTVSMRGAEVATATWTQGRQPFGGFDLRIWVLLAVIAILLLGIVLTRRRVTT